jgi:Txe/YoeB family toxin of toxin-antitoxin system
VTRRATSAGRYVKPIIRLIEDTPLEPFDGIDKPEPLRYVLQGGWSRRIGGKHRSVYLVVGDDIVLLQVGTTTALISENLLTPELRRSTTGW